MGKLFIEMLSNGNYPLYPSEEITEFVKFLCTNKQNPLADKICKIYGEEGFYFLREVYERNGG
jgi:hypothetical protein